MAESVKQAVVVLGVHRSGTSALARALSFFGYELPQDLLPPAPDNPKGFWEPRGIMRLNEKILASYGASWDQPGQWFTRDASLRETRMVLGKEIRRRWRDEALAALQASYPHSASIVLKDPRIALLLPLWKDILATAGFTPHFVLIHRNPLDVAASLKARNEMGARQAFQLWQRHVLSALAPDTGIKPDAVVSFEELTERPREMMKSVLTQLGSPVHADAQGFNQLEDFVSKTDRHHAATVQALDEATHVSGQVKRAWGLLRTWDTLPASKRAVQIQKLCNAYDEAALLFGQLKLVDLSADKQASQPKKAKKPSAETPLDRVDGRLLILHYHLFKNAGSSIDAMLKQNFGTRWSSQEFDIGGGASNAAAVTAYLKERPELFAFSSHTILLPVPTLEDKHIIPILFVRHPIDRLRSAYEFERVQIADTQGAKLAKERDFPGYLRALMALPGYGQARNFQTYRLAFNELSRHGSPRDRALRALDTLPFVGLVEEYDRSLAKLESLVRPFAPGFRAMALRKNVGPKRADSLGERLGEVEREIGKALYSELRAANEDDLALFTKLQKRYGDEVNN